MVRLLASLLNSCRGASCHVVSCHLIHVVEKRSLTGVVDKRHALLSCHVGSFSRIVDTRAVDPCRRLQSVALAVDACLWQQSLTTAADKSR